MEIVNTISSYKNQHHYKDPILNCTNLQIPKNVFQRSMQLPSQTVKNNSSSKTTNNNQNQQQCLNEYLLTSNFFDPSQSSPPNDFLLKLHRRMERYQKKVTNEYSE